MGSSNSTELLAQRLQAPSKPFLASPDGKVLETATQLRITTMSFNATRKIFHAQTNELLFEIENHAFTSRRTLQVPDGKVVMGIKSHAMSRGLYVYDGDQTEQHSYRIDSKVNAVSADFRDCLTGDKCRVLVEGSSSDEVVLVYFERTGPSPLSGGRPRKQREAIGRIQRQKRDYIVEAMPGVDLTLLVMLWLVFTDSSD